MPTDIVGYAHCKLCDSLHPQILLSRLGYVCPACIEAGLERLKIVEVRIGTDRVPYRLRRIRSGSRGGSWAKHQSDKAKLDAMRELRNLFPDLYDALLFRARGRRGLEEVFVTAGDRRLDWDTLEETIERLVATWTGGVA